MNRHEARADWMLDGGRREATVAGIHQRLPIRSAFRAPVGSLPSAASRSSMRLEAP